jgi:hypothetical protein
MSAGGEGVQSEIPRIAASCGLGSAAVQAVIDRHHAISPYGNINELGDLVFLPTRKAGRYSRNFAADVFKTMPGGGTSFTSVASAGPILVGCPINNAATIPRTFASLQRSAIRVARSRNSEDDCPF